MDHCNTDDNVKVDFSILFLILFVLLIETFALMSFFCHRRRQALAVRPKSVKSSPKKQRNSQAMGMKRLLLQQPTDSASDSNPDKKYWEIEYKKIKFKNCIGAGNFGQVWIGTWNATAVAIKTVVKGMAKNEEFRDKFLEEIDLMSQLHHPNIVMFMGACITPPNICLVLELCVFGDLLTFLQSEAEHQVNISMHIMLKMALDIARGINYLHQKKNIIQRDIKSRNVLVDENLNAKVADFGLSRLNDQDVGMTACGTPAWTAPEVVRMEEYSEKVDVYSFAVVMWELIMRDEPYNGEGGVQIAYAAAEQGLRPEVAKFVPEAYAALMTQCWADKPDDRPGFGEILARLFQMMKDESDPVRAPEFYFGKRKKSVVDPSKYLDAEELAAGLLDGDELAEIKAEQQQASAAASPTTEKEVAEKVGEDNLSQIMRRKSVDPDEVFEGSMETEQPTDDAEGGAASDAASKDAASEEATAVAPG